MNICVAKNFVLLKPLGETKSNSGIYIPPETGKEKQSVGEIYQVGDGKQPFRSLMEKGDLVAYEKYMDNTLIIPGLAEQFNPVKFESLTLLIKKSKQNKKHDK